MTAKLEIYTLGGMRFLLDGEPLTALNIRKVEALAIYLAYTKRAQPREVLADMLWDERSQKQALSNLRVALTNLRKHLEPFFTISRDSVVVNEQADFWLDAAEVESVLSHVRVAEGDLSDKLTVESIERALDLYQGEFLLGFHLRDARGFEEWLLVERERLHQTAGDGLSKLVSWYAARGDYSLGIDVGRRWLTLDPYAEAAHQQMIRLLAYSGQPGAALRQYQECLRIFEEELGLSPSEETIALYESIQAGELKPPVGEVLRRGLVEKEELPAKGEPPFKGLAYYDLDDAARFFGRKQLTDRLVEELEQNLKGRRFLAVVGASGSGKSSLVRAGLIATLQSGRNGRPTPPDSDQWAVHLITPTAKPLESLALSLTRQATTVKATAALMDDLGQDPRSLNLFAAKNLAQSNSRRLLLVVDQFEELFALCREESERQAFIDNLVTAVDAEGGPVTVLITLRADFYAHCARYPGLRSLLENQQAYIGQMDTTELRRAIEGPAEREGWAFEPGLVDLLLHDVGAGLNREPEPGALPLLSHALLETWRHRRGRTLTFASYAETGGVRRAIARTAETVFNQELNPEERLIARNIFLRLTELGEGTQDTRRRAKLDELSPSEEELSAVEVVLRTLANARLITTSEDSAEVAHEALIREWPRLQQWLDEDREGLRLHRQLTEAALGWMELEREEGALYRGVRLAQAKEWARSHDVELNPLEREFLEASSELAQRREAEREAQRQRELEAARKLADAESRRAEEQAHAASRLRRRALVLAGALVAAAILAVLAISFGQQASENAQQAAANAGAAQTAEAEALAQKATAESEALARSTQEAQAVSQAELAVTARAEAEAESEIANEERQRAQAAEIEAQEERDAAEEQARLATSRELAAAALSILESDPERSILLALQGLSIAHTQEIEGALHQAVATSRIQGSISAHDGEIWRLAWNSDGTRLATASREGTAKVWDPFSGRELLTLSGHTADVWDVDFDPAGTRLATASSDGTVRVWDALSGQELFVISDQIDWADAVTFSPDGTLLAGAINGGQAKVWDAESGQELLTIEAHQGVMWDVAFNPDGTRLATSAGDGLAKVWDISTALNAGSSAVQEQLTLSGHSAAVSTVVFSPDGSRLATAGIDGKAIVWDGESGQLQLAFGDVQSSSLYRVTFSPDGSRLATAALAGWAGVWDISGDESEQLFSLRGHTGGVSDVAFYRDGTGIVTTGLDGTARLWDASSVADKELLVVGEGRHGSLIRRVAFSPDGTRLATAGMFDGTARVWDVSDPLAPSTNSERELFVLSDQDDGVWDVTFNPDGTLLATAGVDGSAIIWDAASGESLLTVQAHEPSFAAANPAGVTEVDFSPDGKYLATAGADGLVKVWDVTSGEGLFSLNGHTAAVKAVSFSPDGKRMATLSEDGTVKIWDVMAALDSGVSPDVELFSFSEFPDPEVTFDLAFSPDGQRLAMSGSGIVRVWDLSMAAGADSNAGPILFDLAGQTTIAFGVEFSPDGQHLATASQDGKARIWDAATGELLLTLQGYERGLAHVAFGADGQFLATANGDGTARLYVLPVETLVSLAESRVTRSLTEVECQQYLHVPTCPKVVQGTTQP